MRNPTLLAAALSLGACAGAGAQPAPADDLGRLHRYEVAPEQAAPIPAAPDTGFIEVSGRGQVQVEPDQVVLTFAVETRRATATEAASDNAQRTAAALDALRDAGFPGLQLETAGYLLRPIYERPEPRAPMELVAYVATNNIRVTVDDVDAAGRLIDVAVGAGADRIGGISFTRKDSESARHAALEAAVADARAQAGTIARALGRTLGPALEVRGGAQPPVAARMDVARARAAMETTPIEAGDVTVSANVTVRFALGRPPSQR